MTYFELLKTSLRSVGELLQGIHKARKGQIECALVLAERVLERCWEQLHHGDWKLVSQVWRELYGWAAYLKGYCLMSEGQYELSLMALDRALIMGGPDLACRPHMEPLLSQAQRLLFHSSQETDTSSTTGKKPRLEKPTQDVEYHLSTTSQSTIATKKVANEQAKKNEDGEPHTSKVVKCREVRQVRRYHFPSIEKFRRIMEAGEPAVITGTMSHWPAMNERAWKNLTYLKRVAGYRTVPIEVGKHYLDQSWTQKLVTLNEFIDQYVLSSSQTKGYLAQVQLFDLIPELYKDIQTPDYCALGEGNTFKVQAWFGPEGTVSPLHYDPYHNLLAQVVGTKRVRLFSPAQSKYLAPHQSKLLYNTSQIDIENADTTKYPLFTKTCCEECVLSPGEMLYIPSLYWHHVRSLEISFSVSFWWD